MASIHPSPTPEAEATPAVMAEPQAESSSPSAISELQDLFGSLMVPCQDKHDDASVFTRFFPHAWEPIGGDGRFPPSRIEYKWTGAFELFSFPRELRDRIYYHYLYRPEGIGWLRNSTRTWPFEHSEDITSLFLVSRQVYVEAYQVFCRYNRISIGGLSSWSSASDGILRLFPDRPAGMLQRVSKNYFQAHMRYASQSVYRSARAPGDAWVQMMRDAYTFKSFFPRLREFTARWEVYAHFLRTTGFV